MQMTCMKHRKQHQPHNPMTKNHAAPAAVLALGLLTSIHTASAAVYTSGHGDIGFAYEGLNQPYNHFHAEGGIVDGLTSNGEFDAAAITIRVPNTSATTGGTGAGFLGIGDFTTYWKLEQTQGAAAADAAPYLGLSTEDLESADWTNVKFALTAFSGPGQFAMYQSGEPSPIWDTADGVVSAADDHYDWFSVGNGAHDHANYAFSAVGDYFLTITMSGTHATDGVQSATETFHFQVVPEPSTAALVALGVLALASRRRARPPAVIA